jgi:NADH-quinone oxidoreductase subunit C
MGVDSPSGKDRDVAAPLELLRQQFPEGVLETSLPQGDATAIVRPEQLTQILSFLKDDRSLLFNVLVDITAVDHLGRIPRFDVVYNLLSIPFTRRIRIKVAVDGDEPVLETACHIWQAANWLEREVWDMFGIRFKGHPDLRRILLYEEFQGHPLRKDYPIRKRQPRIGPKN